jgi:bifunctional ADP-heptose synthase (sugar kinase/adenylyltransferase)
MDTRTKIVPAEEAARIINDSERSAAQGAIVVTGYFDPLLASHAERLRGLKREGVALIVAIAEPENPILPARARAELVAGLAAVDHVVETAEGFEADVRLEEEDSRRLEALIEHVHARQGAAS